jgi:hypothetical protein
MNSERVIAYTVCTGGYDLVQPPPPDTSGVRWILFTDGDPVDGYETVRVPSCDRKGSRLWKMLPHRHLPPHDVSVYFDACHKWRESPRAMLDQLPTGAEWIGSRHPSARNVWEHAHQVLRFDLDVRDAVARTLRLYVGIEADCACIPMTENNVIVRRNTPAVARCNEEWHRLYTETPCVRDQMTLPMAFLLSGVRPATMPFSGRNNRFYNGFLKHADNEARKARGRRTGPIVVATVSVPPDPVFAHTRPWMERFCREHGYVFEVIDERGPHRSAHWTKFEAGRFFEQYNARAVLLLDSDILIKPGSPSPADLEPKSGVWAFDSMELPYMVPCAQEQMELFEKTAREEMQSIPPCPHYMNSGVVLVWSDAEDFFAPLPFESPVSTMRNLPRFDDQNMMNHRARGRFHAMPRAWNFGHPRRTGNIDRMKMRDIFFLHLNGAEDKVRTVEEMLKWECFKTSTNTVRNEREENSQGETRD